MIGEKKSRGPIANQLGPSWVIQFHTDLVYVYLVSKNGMTEENLADGREPLRSRWKNELSARLACVSIIISSWQSREVNIQKRDKSNQKNKTKQTKQENKNQGGHKRLLSSLCLPRKLDQQPENHFARW